MARIFILSINYAPEPTGFAPHAAAFAEYLSRRGHDVAVFTGFPFAPYWRRREEDRGCWCAVDRSRGPAVYRLTHFIPRRPSSALQRIAMEGSFSLAAIAAIGYAMVRGGRADVVVYLGAQPALAMAARLVAAISRCPYVVNVTDLAAEAALDVRIVNRTIYRALAAFEFAAYRKAAGATVLCRSFADALAAHGYPRSRIRLIRSPIDLHQVRPERHDDAVRRRLGIPEGAFVVMHAGSMGRKQGLVNIVEAAARTRDAPICWVLVGDGEARDEVAAAIRTRQVEDTVRIVPFQPEAELAATLSSADVLLVNQVAAMKNTVIPSKLLTYMAAGRPVIAAVNPASQAAEILNDASGGRIVMPEDPDALAEAARCFMATPQEIRASYGARNRAYAELHFDQQRVLAAHEDFLLDVIRDTAAARSAAA